VLVSGDAAGRPRKRSIALVIEEPGGRGASSGARAPSAPRPPGDGGRWLLVQRPLDDEDLPGEWGLPAGSFLPDESPEALVRRIGRQKLGVSLRPGRRLASGRTVRHAYTLEMTLWVAHVESGTIDVPGLDPTVTQYRDWDWRSPEALAPGAGRGSLCCRLGLEWAVGRSRGRSGP